MMRTVLRLAVPLALIALLFAVTDVSVIVDRLRGADLRWLAVAAAGLAFLTFLMAVRWVWVARGLGIEMSLGHAVREYFLGTLVNQILPGGVAGDAARAVRVPGGDLRAAAQSVVVERMLGQSTTMLLLAAGLAVSVVVPGGVAWPWWTVWVLLAVAVAIAGVIWWRFATVARPSFLAPFWSAWRSPRQAALALVIAVLLNLCFYACARAVDSHLPLVAIFTVVPLTLSAMLIPLSVGGWGWREGAAAALFPLVGASSAEGVATGIAYGAMLLIAALPGLFWWGTRKTRKTDPVNAKNPETS